MLVVSLSMAFRHLAPWRADPHNLFFVTLKKPFDMIAVARSLAEQPIQERRNSDDQA